MGKREGDERKGGDDDGRNGYMAETTSLGVATCWCLRINRDLVVLWLSLCVACPYFYFISRLFLPL